MKKHIIRFCLALLLPALLLPAFPHGVSADGKTLATDKRQYTEGEEILITATGSGNDWVGIYRKGELPDPGAGGETSIRWYYVAKDGNTSGKAKNIFHAEYINRDNLADLPAGDYTLYLLENDGYNVLDKVEITILPKAHDPSKTLSTDKTVYTEGEPILTTATGDGSDWVGLYLRTDTLQMQTSIRWYYVARDGNRSGDTKDMRRAENTNSNRATLFDVPAGEYTLYLLENDGYNILARIDITVNEDPALHPVPQAPSAAAYDRTGSFPGAADGKLTVTAGQEDILPDGYRAYWADANGPLADYTALAPIPCTGKVTAYDMVPNTLIPKAADRLLVYAVRGNKRSETAVEILLPTGCNDYDFGTPLYEFQILSDIHINPSQDHMHNLHFASALADVKTISPNSIGIFINGDIADHGEVSEYVAFQQLIKDAGDGFPNVYAAIGNHDLSAGPFDRQLEKFLTYTQPGTDSVYYDLWLNGVHFIFLGSEAPGLNATLSAEQLAWFREKLAEDRDENRPTYVFLHQGLIDTVAGTFAYQGWHGISQAEQFAEILKDYPEVILFTGHSHWEMDSVQTMKPRDEKLPTIFNTAAGAYLWNDACMATDVGVEGSQGYYLYAYGDKVLLLGRDFVTGQWISSAQFVVAYEKSADDKTPGDDGQETDSSGDEPSEGSTGTEPSAENSGDGASDAVSKDDGGSGMSMGILVGGITASLVAVAATILFLRKKRKSGQT